MQTGQTSESSLGARTTTNENVDIVRWRVVSANDVLDAQTFDAMMGFHTLPGMPGKPGVPTLGESMPRQPFRGYHARDVPFGEAQRTATGTAFTRQLHHANADHEYDLRGAADQFA